MFRCCIRRVKRKFAAVEDQLKLGLLHELQGLQRSTAKVFRRQESGDVSTAIDVQRPEFDKPKPAMSPMVLAAIIAAALAVIALVLFLVLR